MRLAVLVVCALWGCKKTAPPEREGKPAPATTRPTVRVDAAPPDAAPTAPAPGKLEVCGTAVDREPLAALCTLGEPAARAVYDCAEPRPIMFCKGAVQWTCFRNGPAGETGPPVQFSAFHASDAPQPKTGQLVDLTGMKRDGETVGVEIQWIEADDARGAAQVRSLVGRLTGWGCIVTFEYRGTQELDCGSWTAKVTYNDIIDYVILDGVLRDRYSCR